MRSYSFLCLSLVSTLALACDSKGNDSDTSDIATTGGSSDGESTDGVSSTGGDVTGDPMTSSGGSATDVGTSVGTSVGTATDPTATTGDIDTTGMTSSTSVGTSVGTSMTSEGETEDPPAPSPCEGEAVELDVAALAYTAAQIPPQPDPTGGSSSTGGDPTDPDTLYVRLGNQVATCADPNAGLDCGPNWEVTIRIPPAFQTPGLYHLLGPDVVGTAMETGADEGGGECSFGGGSFIASFELISVDDQQVTGRLCHVEPFFFDNKVDLEGSFTAPRCK